MYKKHTEAYNTIQKKIESHRKNTDILGKAGKQKNIEKRRKPQENRKQEQKKQKNKYIKIKTKSYKNKKK